MNTIRTPKIAPRRVVDYLRVSGITIVALDLFAGFLLLAGTRVEDSVSYLGLLLATLGGVALGLLVVGAAEILDAVLDIRDRRSQD